MLQYLVFGGDDRVIPAFTDTLLYIIYMQNPEHTGTKQRKGITR